MTPRGRVARVILDSPLPQLDHELDYAVPDALSEELDIGSLVSVPLRGGSRFVDGWVVARVDESDYSGALQPINKVVSGVPVLSVETLALARRIATRQAGSVSDVLRLVIPPRYVRTEKAWIAAHSEPDSGEAQGDCAPAQGNEYALNLEASTRVSVRPPIAWRPLEASGVVVDVPSWALNFASEAARVFAHGESSILAVPDYRDLHHVLHALDYVGVSQHVIRTDTGLESKDRYRNYLDLSLPQPRIIVGNRSVVLAPAHRLGFIALWDDGDENYQEPLAPYHHARDVALVRQSIDNARLVFAAHVPSVDVVRLIELEFLAELTLVTDKPLITATDVVDDQERAIRIPSSALLAARNAVHDGPVLIQVATPGFSPAVMCSSCRELARCTSCHGPLGIRSRNASPQCRWCSSLAASWSCTHCGGKATSPVGFGAERTAADIGRAFPGVPIVIADGVDVLERVPAKPTVVIATGGAEPVAERGYRAVLLLDGEKRRFRQSLRADENALRVWTQAATLAATGAPVFVVGAGEMLGAALSLWEFVGIGRAQLAERQALRLPPASRIASITGPESQVRTALNTILGIKSVRVLGTSNEGDGVLSATVTCDYRDNDEVATALRARVVSEATSGPRARSRNAGDQRVVKLRVRFDESTID